MAKLYELTEQYSNLMELLDNPEVPQEMLEESLNKINDELDVKLENIAKLIKSIEVDVKGFKEEEKRLANRRKSSENRITNLKEYVKGAMRAVGLKKIKGRVFTLGIQRNAPSVEITKEESIPEKYFILEKKLVKKDILAALKEGKEVPGATIKQTESLRIR
ncbi:siphovirus Gp157 family protein [Clostridium cochlearium]|uniref:siphovirus Gp157 family protein n=1 Tax=Clostridium cochlearium TaxID=1494 RepID=UPI001570F57A|nr:siphovirus Gp157 family protein [Clostridium cochlearium]MBV1816900.1 siphovirus Gp157 family protein [Bacteroidales bacterium MSK.15.36]MCG4571735.1 siphovirus Gp157 family protein [Clostridium cochlearium]MCG4579064.1 siphovirus Gp157 family protein [Clostridium cochlearium]NSJ90177.1 siphovirus Gp157 family protein [Coprococcus sp. MSK.21.13]